MSHNSYQILVDEKTYESLCKTAGEVDEKDNEIERLNRLLNSAAYGPLVEKDAEIDRLRAAYQSSQFTVLKYWEQRNLDRKLIEELAEALAFFEDPEIAVTKELLQRAGAASEMKYEKP